MIRIIKMIRMMKRWREKTQGCGWEWRGQGNVMGLGDDGDWSLVMGAQIGR